MGAAPWHVLVGRNPITLVRCWLRCRLSRFFPRKVLHRLDRQAAELERRSAALRNRPEREAGRRSDGRAADRPRCDPGALPGRRAVPGVRPHRGSRPSSPRREPRQHAADPAPVAVPVRLTAGQDHRLGPTRK